MGKVADAKSKVLGFMSTIQTLLDNYPQPKMSNRMMNLLNSNTPFGFLMNLLAICGISERDLLDWMAKILCGQEILKNPIDKAKKDIVKNSANGKGKKVSDGVLDVIEYAIKTILLLNVKNMFTCSLNPFIPNDVLKYPNGTSGVGGFSNGKGIKISIPTIDLFNTLDFCPTDKKGGKFFYFDNEYNTNEIWKSTDFNAFLWYAINKAIYDGDEKLKCVWDNRVWKRTELGNNNIFRDNFFNIGLGDGSFVNTSKPQTNISTTNYPNRPENKKAKVGARKDDNQIKKKQFIIVEYQERDSVFDVPNSLSVWLNADRYRYSLGGSNNFYLNKTVFEFNYDFIFSLKLFDSKVIVANVINAILGITNSAASSLMNGKYSLQQKLVQGQVGKIVKQLMNGEDEVINDCFFSFSNDDLNSLLEESELKKYNNYQFGETYGSIDENDISLILENVNNLSNSSTLEELQTNIANVFTNITDTVSAKNDMVEISDKFAFSGTILFKLIEESVTQIVMQVLSPKVMLLFALNSYFMGDVTDGDFRKINIEHFLKGLSNLISSIVKQVFDILLKELLQFIMDEIRPLLLLAIEKLLMERVRFYIDLLKRLYALIMMFINAFKGGPKPTSIIDNVNYADIVPSTTAPPNENNIC